MEYSAQNLSTLLQQSSTFRKVWFAFIFLIRVLDGYKTLKEIRKWVFLLYDLILYAVLWFLKCVWENGPLLPCMSLDYSWFLEAISLQRPLVKEQSEEGPKAAPSTCVLSSDQDQKVLYLISIWTSPWTQRCSICAPSHSSLVPIFIPDWWLEFLVWPWTFPLAMDLMGVCWTLGWYWLPSWGLIQTVAHCLVFLDPFQWGLCLSCDAQLLSCLLQGNLPLLLPCKAKGKESQYSLKPTMCIILPKFLLFATVTQSLNLSACKWPWSCMSQCLWVFMFSLFPASHI